MSIYTDEQRKSTASLIEEFGFDVALSRKGDQIRTPAGGIRRVDDPIDLPPRRRYFGSTGSNPVVITTANGTQIAVGFVLIGLMGDDIQKGDTFELNSETYKVIEIDPVTAAYQRKGWVDRLG